MGGPLAALIGAAALLGAAPAVASAACPASPTSTPFLRFLDISRYSPVPGGSFESEGQGWTLSAAETVSANESFEVAGGTHSLRLAAGGVAVSPSLCLDIAEPTFRFFVRSASTDPAALHVALRWSNAFGGGGEVALGTVAPSQAWAPSPVMLLDLALPLSLLESTFSSLHAKLVFEAAPGAGAAQIDDVYYDPYSR